MSAAKQIIDLVKDAIDTGLARIETAPGNERNFPIVRFILSQTPDSDQPQYVGEIRNDRDSEPVEVTIARRLASGNLNIAQLRKDVSVPALHLISQIDKIGFREPGEDRVAFESRFNEQARQAYPKVIQIYRLDPLAPDTDALWQARAGNQDAIKALDAKGYYKKSEVVTLADTFSLKDTLNQAAQKNDVGPGDIIKMDQTAYVNNSGIFAAVAEFSGSEDLKRSRLKEPKTMSLADLFR